MGVVDVEREFEEDILVAEIGFLETGVWVREMFISVDP